MRTIDDWRALDDEYGTLYDLFGLGDDEPAHIGVRCTTKSPDGDSAYFQIPQSGQQEFWKKNYEVRVHSR